MAGPVIRAEQVVATARAYVGTPYRDQGRIRGRCVDCAGLVICVAWDLGLSTFDKRDYALHPDPDEMRRVLDAHLDKIAIDALRPGSIVRLANEGNRCHLGIIAERRGRMSLIHAVRSQGVVVEHGYDPKDRRFLRFIAGYEYPGVAR